MRRRLLVVALSCVAALSALTAGVAQAAPEDPGPNPVTTQTMDIPVGGSVSLTTDVYLPGAIEHAPLVVLRHGYLRARGNLAGWGTHLASHGFVTAVFDSRDNTNDDPQTDGADMDSVTAWLLASSNDASSPLFHRMDAARLAMGGHSAGGAAAAVAASGLSGVGALVLLDSEDTGPSLAVAPSLTVPTIGIFGAPSTCNENGDNRKTYAAVTGPRLGIYVTGASHCDAEDPLDTLCGIACGSTNDARHAAFKRYATAFLEAYLQCDATAYPYVGGAAAMADTAITILPATNGLALPPSGCGADAGTPVDHEAGAEDSGASGSGADAAPSASNDASAHGSNGESANESGCALAPGHAGESAFFLGAAAAVLAGFTRRRGRRTEQSTRAH